MRAIQRAHSRPCIGIIQTRSLTLQPLTTHRSYQPNKIEAALEHDLEMLSLAWCRRDDVSLMRDIAEQCSPGVFEKALVSDLPEVMEVGSLAGRKLGGVTSLGMVTGRFGCAQIIC